MGLARIFSIACAVAVSAATVVIAAPARSPDAPARSLSFACASPAFGTNGVMHFATRPNACRGTLVEFAADQPVSVCRKEHGRGRGAKALAHTRGPAGLIRLVDDPRSCGRGRQPNETVRSLPRSKRTNFCAGKAAGVLRWVSSPKRCTRREFAVVLGPRGEPGARTSAGGDDATADEDHAISVPALANDAPGSPRRRLSIVSVDASAARGAVTTNDDGTLGYDPGGRFDSLKAAQSARDTFRYRVTDGVHTADGTVAITVTGVNDAPTATDDSAFTSEGATRRIDVVTNDADVENDAPLVLNSVDSLGAGGGTVTPNGDGSVDYDPAGRFEAVGEGQTATDTFGYDIADPAGAVSSRALARVSVSGENDNPSLGGVEASAAAVGSGPAPTPASNRVAARITVSDVDSNPGLGGDAMHGATVEITSGLDTAHHDTLEATTLPSGISASYDPVGGRLTLSGAVPRADYEAALRGISFHTDIDAPTSERTVSFRVDDGAAANNLSNVVARDVEITNALPSIATDPPLTPGFSSPVADYAIRCTGTDPVDVQVEAPDGTEVAVDRDDSRSGTFSTPVELSAGQAFRLVVSRGDYSATDNVRCLPANFPAYEATVSGTPQAGWYFVTSRTPAGGYAMVFNNDGVPVWWMAHPVPPGDFKLLSNGHVGWFSMLAGPDSQAFHEFDLDGTLVRDTTTVGVPTDGHDYEEEPNGNRYLMSYKLRDHVDVSAYTGLAQDTDAAVIDAEVQELDPAGNLVWKWKSEDHIDLAETGRWWALPPAHTADGRNKYDIVHINSIEDDGDAIIISMRHNDAVYRIDKATGAIDWKLGGTTRPESLMILGDTLDPSLEFGGQHDARRLSDGTLTIHDNGTQRGRRPRALRFEIDPVARTATVVEIITDPEIASSGCCGSARKLPGGNWVMSWGASFLVTELAPDGSRPFRLTLPSFSYRAAPVLPDDLSAQDLRDGMDAQFPRP